MKKIIIVVIGCCLFLSEANAQFTRYIIKLKDKGGNPFSLSDPSPYLSQRAILRRTKYNIAIDSTDLPITPSYFTQIKSVPNVTVLNISKWNNSIAIQTSDPNAITTINGLSFVQSVMAMGAQTQNDTIKKLDIADQPYNPIGDIFVKNALTDTVGLSSLGGTTYSFVDSKLKMDMSSASSLPSELGILPRIEIDSVTSLDVLTAEAIISYDTIADYGVGLSIFSKEGYTVEAWLYGGQGDNLGRLFLNGHGPGPVGLLPNITYSAGKVPSIDVGDSILIKLETYENKVTISARNLTDNSDWTTLNYTYIGTQIKHGIGHIAITQRGGRVFLHQLKYYSKQIKNPEVYLFGDSKFTKSTIQDESLVALLKNNYGLVYANSGPGAYSQQLLDNRWEVINFIKPKKILISVSNDIRFGISSSVWQANLTQLYNEFTTAGIDVYFTSFYETSTSQQAMDTWLAANYPLKYIRKVYTDLANTPGVLLSDSTHLSASGNKVAHDAIVSDGKLAPTTGIADFFNYGTGSHAEINLHKGQFLHNIGLRGQGMIIALLDGGFLNYTTLDAMDSIIINNQVLDTWDFYSNNTIVSDDHPHGMQCLSTIAADIPGQLIGKAPKANFLLYRTEDAFSEYPIEEFNMVCGMERADSAGADVISASLGYSEFNDASFNHTYLQMNGNTTIAATGAELAGKKGILIVVAAGNEGSSAWHYIITPADGNNVLAVGAVDTNGTVGSFSSYGPSGDERVKPDLASPGIDVMVQSTTNTIATGSGTSFACSNMAGLSTILWQAFPEVNNLRILRALQEAGSIASSPNNRIGYGIPDLKSAFGTLLTEFATSSSTIDTCTITVRWTSKDVSAMKYEIERKLPGQPAYTKLGELFPQPGNLLATHNYVFSNTIINSPTGSVSYRIRQIIDTGSISFNAVYIDTTAVSITSGCFANFLASTATSSATINNCTATLNWYSKDNGTMKYEIERKLPDEPGFTKIADVPAQQGTVLSWRSYSFTNTIINSPSGIVTYRIRQIIDTSATSFVDVYLPGATVNISDQCFPNYLINTAISSTTISGCTVVVKWSSTDYGAMKYEIERKSPDETNYLQIGEVTANAGRLLANHSYEFTNTLDIGSSGTFSYRIRQIIDTTTAKFSAVYIDTTNANVLSSCVSPNKFIAVRPNPSIGSTTRLIIETPDAIPSMPILVYTADGRLVQHLQVSKGPGKKIIDLSTGKLVQGKYIINVYNKNVLIGTAGFIKL